MLFNRSRLSGEIAFPSRFSEGSNGNDRDVARPDSWYIPHIDSVNKINDEYPDY